MAKGFLTTHVLDTARGVPVAGLVIDLFVIEADQRNHIRSLPTNSDGRTDGQILPAAEFSTGTCELVFHAGDYLDRLEKTAKAIRFLDVIPIRFGITDVDSHYHVPLLLSPFGYSTYRGS
ncbi:MAG TPA: hydroxyisourate hydrolase [Rhodobacteraceae bacterium]|jgi:5-hydroxyisourate hydrolase|nr:hydroxyisourate hydrolase [Paracoccaceae bacterium]